MILNEIEKVILKRKANLFRGIESVGGWLHLTNERIVFEPHKINFQQAPVDILLKDIEGIDKRNSLFVVPNGISIKVKSGNIYKFVIGNRKEWIGLINEHGGRS